MREHDILAPWVRRFLLEHLVAERNLARNTQVSYRDTLTQALPFFARKAGRPVDRLRVEDVSAERIRSFLDHVERDRGCGTLTRNHRLAALHSLARFIGTRSAEHVAWCAEVRNVPFKKATKTTIEYLDKPEVEALLRTPDRTTRQGQRDHALLLFLYNSGARADEATNLQVGNLMLGTSPAVRILGKGNKWRICPLWSTTADALGPLVLDRSAEHAVFRGRTGEAMTRFGVHRIVATTAATAAATTSTLQGRSVSPHTLRHTTAVHLLRAGVDINTIRAWLGHVSLDTTNIYAEVDIAMKAKALAAVQLGDQPQPGRRRPPALLDFLHAI